MIDGAEQAPSIPAPSAWPSSSPQRAHHDRARPARDLAETVGIKAASINYYFPTKAALGEAVAKQYWEETAADLDAISVEAQDEPVEALRRYPSIFRASLERDNRICLSSFMATENDDLPGAVLKEAQTFADVNVAWLNLQLTAAAVVSAENSEARARAIAGAQIFATSRSDLSAFDGLIESYRAAGPLPR